MERENRRLAFDKLFDACEQLVGDSVDYPFANAVFDEANVRYKQDVDAASGGPTPPVFAHQAFEMARWNLEWWDKVRRGLPSVVDTSNELHTDHRVKQLTVPLHAMQMMLTLANDDTKRIPRDVDAVVALARELARSGRPQVLQSERPWIENVGKRSHTAITELARVANRLRGEGYDPDQIDLTYQSGFGGNSSMADALPTFVRLKDMLEAGDTP